MNKVLINNKCENPVEVGTGLIFREDGTYIVSVYNGKITVYESGASYEKSDEIPPEILQACKNNEEKIKDKIAEMNKELIEESKKKIVELSAEIAFLRANGASVPITIPPPKPIKYMPYCGMNGKIEFFSQDGDRLK